MRLIEIVLLGIGLAMDAFAVSICKGLAIKKTNLKKTCIIGLWFGIFQAIMPIFGYFLGNAFEHLISEFDHWIAFGLLGFIGINMIKEAFVNDNNTAGEGVEAKEMVILALATSIDALAVGVTFAFLNVNLIVAISIIGVETFLISAIGVIVGSKFGNKFENNAQVVGGLVLIMIGTKILLNHLGII